MSVFLLEVGSIFSFSLLSVISSKVPPFESREFPTSQVSDTFWRVPPTSYLPRLPVSILSAGPQGFSPFPSPNTRSGSPFLPITPPPSHLLSFPGPSLLTTCDWFLLSPKWDWVILTWTPTCWPFWVLRTVFWVFCLFLSFFLFFFFFFLLIFTY